MKKIVMLAFIGLWTVQITAQEDPQVIDEIIAVVGDELVLLSDLEGQKAQYRQQGLGDTPDMECQVFETLLFENLLLHRAKVDSVVVSEIQVESELDRRIAMFSQQLGGEEALEEFYGKKIAQIRSDFYEVLEEQLLIQTMQQNLTADVRVTPAEIEQYYKDIPQDSIPLIDSQVEVAQILIKPEPSAEEVKAVKDRLRGFKEEVAGGKDFATLAILYSEDPGSATKGGELGLVTRGTMVPAFERVAYNLDEGEVSNVFKTDYGYHLMQMIERKGDYFNARHILISPKLRRDDLQAARKELEDIRVLIDSDSLTFQQAALKFSDDEGSRNNNGIIVNPNTGSLRFDMDELDPQMFLLIDKLEVGAISEPAIMQSQRGEQAYRIVKLRDRSDAHKANLVEDYQLFQNLTKQNLSEEAMGNWTRSNIERTYINIDEDRQGCRTRYNWTNAQ